MYYYKSTIGDFTVIFHPYMGESEHPGWTFLRIISIQKGNDYYFTNNEDSMNADGLELRNENELLRNLKQKSTKEWTGTSRKKTQDSLRSSGTENRGLMAELKKQLRRGTPLPRTPSVSVRRRRSLPRTPSVSVRRRRSLPRTSSVSVRRRRSLKNKINNIINTSDIKNIINPRGE